MQDKSDVMMQELFGTIASKAVEIYQQSTREKLENEYDSRMEIELLMQQVEDKDEEISSLNRKISELQGVIERHQSETDELKSEIKELRILRDQYHDWWLEEVTKKNTRPDAATSDQEASK
ncbi:MAG: hypothetical protein PWP59_1780 [Sphaerochaeta sp.]|nr:hypothetical protein [Sphaerochaeta sp.]